MSQELLQGLGSVTTNGSSVKLVNDYLLFTGYVWPSVVTSYIPIQDCTHTFEYDFTFESDAGNYFYIGVERYTANKTTGSNNSCIYQVATSNTAKSKNRVRGTVNLNQVIADGLKTSYIRLRILNNWSSSTATNATAKIYHLSIREIIDDASEINVAKTGVIKTDTVWENFPTASINKLKVIESNNLIEY